MPLQSLVRFGRPSSLRPVVPRPHIGGRVFTTSSFPGTQLACRVELYLNGTWTDVTSYVYVRNPIRITRGRPDGAIQSQPSTCTLTTDNRDGRWCSSNLTGAWYGQLRLGTKLRVCVDHGAGLFERFTGEISALPPRYGDPSENDRYVLVSAAGVTSRLGRGSTSKSALKRTILAANPVAYWPMEDADGSTYAASSISSGPPLTVSSGTVTFAGWTTPPAGSSTAPDLTNSGRLAGSVSGITSTAWSVEFVANCTEAAFDIPVEWYVTGGTWGIWRIFAQPTSVDGPLLAVLNPGDFAGTPVTTFPRLGSFNGVWHHYRVTASQSGADVAVVFYVDGVAASRTLLATTLGAVNRVAVNSDGGGTETITGSVAHLAFYNSVMATDHFGAMGGYAGELAATRYVRLCTEEGVDRLTTATRSEAMGPQRAGALMTLLGECVDTDVAALNETRAGVLWFQGHSERYNLGATLALDHNSGHIAPDFQPTDDGQQIRNDWTISRTTGSSARVERTTGAMSTADPPTGVGRYDDSKSIVCYTDSQLPHHAGWRTNLGTVEGLRYPQLPLNFARSPLMIDAWLACDLGSRVTVDNPPPGIPPHPIDVIIEGYTETLGPFRWDVMLNCSPERPYEVFQIETGSGNRSRIAAGVSTTDLAYSASATSLSVTSASVRWIDSATYPTKFPILVECAGEVMTCTAIAGTGLTQTFTVTRGLHGVTKALPITSQVQIWRAPCIAL